MLQEVNFKMGDEYTIITYRCPRLEGDAILEFVGNRLENISCLFFDSEKQGCTCNTSSVKICYPTVPLTKIEKK